MPKLKDVHAPFRISVVLPLPIFEHYTYLVDHSLINEIKVGQRVVVPFQGRLSVAYVVALNVADVEGVKLKTIYQILDASEPTFQPTLINTLNWVAAYYHAPLGEVLKAAHPAGTNGKSQPALKWCALNPPAELSNDPLEIEAFDLIREHSKPFPIED